MPKSSDRLLAAVTVVLAVGLALLGAEIVLAWYDARVAGSSEMDPGLLRYDPALGWVLTPNWRGHHRHHDFDVVYSVNSEGFRGEFSSVGAVPRRERVAILGDSFTFGLGVGDDETFASALGRLNPNVEFLNFGVPGYSTDQALLMLDAHVMPHRPNLVWLAFFLGNDLLDNGLDYPLQADQAKPRFEVLDDGSLVLRGVPVRRDPKPAVARDTSIEEIAFGDALENRRTVIDRLRSSSHLLGRLLPAASIANRDALRETLAVRLVNQQRLLDALLAQLLVRAREQSAELVLIPLPGQSLVEQPESAAAAFQAYVSAVVVAEAQRLGIAAADPLESLRIECGAARCFHPNEGHYTAAAHAIVARFLLDWKSQRAAQAAL